VLSLMSTLRVKSGTWLIGEADIQRPLKPLPRRWHSQSPSGDRGLRLLARINGDEHGHRSFFSLRLSFFRSGLKIISM
jgi:hypothetical protein